MKSFSGKGLRWDCHDGVIDLTLDRAPANEIGTAMLDELEQFVAALPALAPDVSACIFSSAQKHGFSAGADLRELYERAEPLPERERGVGVREFLQRIHAAFNVIDAAPFVTIAAVHGVCFGGGLELALVCDLIIADKMARFAFPELRLGLIPGFGGIPRLKRDLGNGFVRDLLFTGRSECHSGTRRWTGRAANRRRRSPESSTFDRRANHQVRRRHSSGSQEIYQADSSR